MRARQRCRTDAATRRRLLALAAERNIPPAEYELMHKRVLMPSIQNFCRKYDVSLDWLLGGDLKGLKRMKKWEREDQGMTADQQRAESFGCFSRSRPQSKKPHSNGSNSKRRSATMRKPKKPAAPKLGKGLSADEVQERRAKAFFDMEEPLRNCSDHAEIAGELLRAGRQDLCRKSSTSSRKCSSP